MHSHVYIVECSDGTLYTGMSQDYEKRIEAHNAGRGAKYTKTRRPVRLVYLSACSSRREAAKLEYMIKQLSRVEKIDLCEDWRATYAAV